MTHVHAQDQAEAAWLSPWPEAMPQEEARRLVVRVRSGAGLPVAGAQVTLSGEGRKSHLHGHLLQRDSAQPLGAGTTNADGEVSFEPIPQQYVMVVARRDQDRSQHITVGPKWSATVTIDLILDAAGQIDVLVLEAMLEHPIADALVQLEPNQVAVGAPQSALHDRVAGRTGADGHARLEGVTAGPYVATCSARGFSSARVETHTSDFLRVVHLKRLPHVLIEVLGSLDENVSCLLIQPSGMFSQGHVIESDEGRQLFQLSHLPDATGVILVDPGAPWARELRFLAPGPTQEGLVPHSIRVTDDGCVLDVRMPENHPCLPYLEVGGVPLPIPGQHVEDEPSVVRFERLGTGTYDVLCGQRRIPDNTNALGQVALHPGQTTRLDVSPERVAPHHR